MGYRAFKNPSIGVLESFVPIVLVLVLVLVLEMLDFPRL
jgi:hypothetical protein